MHNSAAVRDAEFRGYLTRFSVITQMRRQRRLS